MLSKVFPMSQRYIFKINITHVRIINHKLINISVNSPNNSVNINSLHSGLFWTPLWSLTRYLSNLSNLSRNSLAIWSIRWFIMRNWITILLSPLYCVMLLLVSDIFKFKDWLVNKKYIYSSPTPSCVHTPLMFHSKIGFSLKYARYAFVLSSHLFSAFVELISTPNIAALVEYPNMCLWFNNEEKYESKQRRNYDHNFMSNK